MKSDSYYVYILTNRHKTVFYIGVTSNLIKRQWQHKQGVYPGFTKKYNVHSLIYYECFSSPREAIQREKELKGWRREKKLNLIKNTNPDLLELINL